MPHKPKNTLLAATVGSALEWYDFLLYAYFASLLAPLFFPARTQFISLLLTYSAFAIGFLVRPFSAIVIGHFGDVHGRRKALIFTITLMTVPTILMGLLPTYATIGIWAPILLTLIRCLQGFAVSGEINSAAAFLVEHAANRRRGFAGSLVMASSFFGILLGAVVVTLLSAFISTPTLHAGAWRIPFLLSAVFGVFGLIIRLRTLESPQFQTLKSRQQLVRTPIKTLFSKQYVMIIKGTLITTIVAIANYVLLSYFNAYLQASAKFSLNHAMLINSISVAVFVFVLILFGLISDKIGRKRLFMIGCTGLFVVAIPVFLLLAQHTFYAALAGELLFAIILAMTDGVILTLLAELFTTEVRNSGTALTYNISLAIFGGTAPLIALTLVHWTQHDLAPAIYIMSGALLSFIMVATVKETHDQPLS